MQALKCGNSFVTSKNVRQGDCLSEQISAAEKTCFFKRQWLYKEKILGQKNHRLVEIRDS
ncbi:hypothetical protein B2G51_14645 [Leptospira santarosai]|nr:hypothetical protein B2G51_14645 [Leptospira santarosai]OLY62953.1 hypothetical protein BWD11_17445 [Leptospira santarosai serovar Grippotyphosa]